MKIQSVKELEQLKNASASKVGIRAGATPEGADVEITVGTATCGLAAGAEDVVKAINEEKEKLGLKNLRVVKVGCIGFCYCEPIVQVNMPGAVPVYYGNVNADTAREIVRKHVANNEYVDGAVINLEFDRV